MGIMAEARLAAGRSAQAAEVASACLKENPDAHRCTSVLARAKAAAGRCDKALPLFAQLRSTNMQWDERTAMQEGVCRLRNGDFYGAVAVFTEAIALKPAQPLTWFQRSMASIRLHDFSTFPSDIAEIRDSKRPAWMAEILEAWWALETDGNVDGLIAEAYSRGIEKTDPQVFQQFALIDCHRWLDVGDPWEAAQRARAGVRTSQGQTRVVACHGEALRRQGDAHNAWYLVDRPWHRDTQSVALLSVGVRILADLGRMTEAQERFSKLPVTAVDEYLSTAWYLARKTGDTETQQRMRKEWDAIPRPDGRSLDTYIPVQED